MVALASWLGPLRSEDCHLALLVTYRAAWAARGLDHATTPRALAGPGPDDREEQCAAGNHCKTDRT